MRLAFDDCVMDVDRRELRRGGELVAVEPQVFDLLLYLARNPERVIRRDELLQAIWDGRVVSDSAIANRLNAARRAIGDSGGAQRLIRTVPRKGVRFIGAVETRETERVSVRPKGLLRRPALLAAGVLLCVAFAGFLLSPAILSRIGAPREDQSLGYPSHPGIAVLPLSVLGDAAQPGLAAGLTEQLVTELSRHPDLQVIQGITAAYQPNSRNATRRPWGVSYVVAGSVEQANGQVRFTARLADAETGVYLWADQFGLPAGDRLSLEDQIVGRTANAVYGAIVRNEASRPGAGVFADAIWRGRFIRNGATSHSSLGEALQQFERALKTTPASPTAKIDLASALVPASHGLFGINDKVKLQRAADLIDSKLVANPNNAEAHLVKGEILRFRGNCGDAIGEFEAATTTLPNFTSAYRQLSSCKLITGAFSDVIPLAERTIRLDPGSPLVGVDYQRIGMLLLLQSRPDEAIPWLEKARAADLTAQAEYISQVYSSLAAAYALQGDADRAADALSEARKSRDYPASVAQYREQSPLSLNEKGKSLADATYFRGLRLAGLPER